VGGRGPRRPGNVRSLDLLGDAVRLGVADAVGQGDVPVQLLAVAHRLGQSSSLQFSGVRLFALESEIPHIFYPAFTCHKF
jgi:hypothetical protein